jgi:hypothetical protein
VCVLRLGVRVARSEELLQRGFGLWTQPPANRRLFPSAFNVAGCMNGPCA